MGVFRSNFLIQSSNYAVLYLAKYETKSSFADLSLEHTCAILLAALTVTKKGSFVYSCICAKQAGCNCTGYVISIPRLLAAACLPCYELLLTAETVSVVIGGTILSHLLEEPLVRIPVCSIRTKWRVSPFLFSQFLMTWLV